MMESSSTFDAETSTDRFHCDVCLAVMDTRLNFQEHLRTMPHVCLIEEDRKRVENVLLIAEGFLSEQSKEELRTLERCYICGATRVPAVVKVTCCHCRSAADDSNRSQVTFQEAVPGGKGGAYFLCVPHARNPFCMRCGCVLSVEAYCLD